MGQVIDLDEKDRLEWEEENAHYKQTDSKSKVKKDMLEITEFGRNLIELSKERLEKMPIDETILQQIFLAKKMQKIALKRQVQYIGKLLRKTDNLEELQAQYDKLTNKSKEVNALFHRLENIRDILVDKEKGSAMLQQIIAEMPNLDVQQLRQLIRNHHKETEKNKPKKSYRQIFQLLKEASPDL